MLPKGKNYLLAALDLSTYISYTIKQRIFPLLSADSRYMSHFKHEPTTVLLLLLFLTTTQKPFKINTIFPHYKIYCCSVYVFFCCLLENSINSFSSSSCFLMINNFLCAQIHILFILFFILLLPNEGKNGKISFLIKKFILFTVLCVCVLFEINFTLFLRYQA